MKKSLLATLLSAALVVAFAASALATPIWTATTGVGTEFTKAAGTWNSGPVTIGEANTTFNFDFNVVGSWDGMSDPNTRLVDGPGGKATWDWLTINVYKDGGLLSSFVYDDLDNGGNTFDPRKAGPNVHYESLLALSGVYAFEAIGHMTMGGDNLEAETWILNSANVTPTPLPAAVWLLGSGLLGLVGVKRSRKTAAA
ncbi:MAG: VPLPA-CTERM sorting domain-containing protein [Proteobacteria bacterium]|nr:VPLPA-CTERM sorting domain-containing protein [Pseudomonadota bacterium]MBU1595308.1 VPLPA-CTERM sorting domain-containing protein [Pseudomonadota bacterium]